MKILNWVKHDSHENLVHFCFTADGAREVYSVNGASLHAMLVKSGAPKLETDPGRTRTTNSRGRNTPDA